MIVPFLLSTGKTRKAPTETGFRRRLGRRLHCHGKAVDLRGSVTWGRILHSGVHPTDLSAAYDHAGGFYVCTRLMASGETGRRGEDCEGLLGLCHQHHPVEIRIQLSYSPRAAERFHRYVAGLKRRCGRSSGSSSLLECTAKALVRPRQLDEELPMGHGMVNLLDRFRPEITSRLA